ncbi:MAG: hypothetical protein IH585_13530, partial [Anaerolineaceae bacterium]|nr:hypothetical protein [Anaerolineaceae bacterium]
MKKLLGLLSIVMILSMVLSACVSQVTPTPEPVAPVEEPTAVVEEVVEPTPEPVEEVVEVEEPELGPVLKIGQ